MSKLLPVVLTAVLVSIVTTGVILFVFLEAQQGMYAPVMAPTTSESYANQNAPATIPQDTTNTTNTNSTQAPSNPPSQTTSYPNHQNIIATIFWAGEPASSDNGNISNVPSAWDDLWSKHAPGENTFYVALPYNDFGKNGTHKKNITSVYWYSSKSWGDTESLCKNQWVKITSGDKTVYGQWEDVGPFLEDDVNYVFGNAQPSNTKLEKAGIDMSPAIQTYLGAGDVSKVSWQFVAASDVPDGPWKKVVTTSQVFWQ